MPEPVGALTMPDSPESIACQVSCWKGKGDQPRDENQVRAGDMSARLGILQDISVTRKQRQETNGLLRSLESLYDFQCKADDIVKQW